MPASLREATEPVYHYTSSTGLLGLVQTGCVWASEATSLNDLAEVRHGWDVVKSWLARQPASEAVDLLTKVANDPFEKKHEVFVLSGSTARDDANQWRLYAQGGNGYALKLDPRVALAAISDAPETKQILKAKDGSRTLNIGWYLGESATVTPWYHVLYTEGEVAAALSELLTATDRELPKLADARDDVEYAQIRDVLYGQALEALGAIAHLVKGAGFSGEREVRVVATFMLANQHIRYRQGPHGIVSYGLLTRAPKGHPPIGSCIGRRSPAISDPVNLYPFGQSDSVRCSRQYSAALPRQQRPQVRLGEALEGQAAIDEGMPCRCRRRYALRTGGAEARASMSPGPGGQGTRSASRRARRCHFDGQVPQLTPALITDTGVVHPVHDIGPTQDSRIGLVGPIRP